MVVSNDKIKEQIEYYMGDQNLSKDKFFREQIQTDKDGYISVSHFLNCNNVKKQKWTSDEIVAACKSSDKLEVKGQKIRRKGNLELPDFAPKKRDAKAQDKKADNAKASAQQEQEDQRDELGRHILVEKDFDNPLIITYETKVKKGDDFKVDWKQVEAKVKEAFPGLKLIYSRMDEHSGHLAFSSLRLKQNLIDELCSKSLHIQDRPFTFSKTTGEELKEFWQKQGGHFQFCIQNRLRAAKKAQKARTAEKQEKVKRAKNSYEIAGVYYLDINKVKSKSRAILNLKKDGEQLDGNDAEFVKELLSQHERCDEKMKDYDHFEVNTHPKFDKTRCFFVVRKDGTKEDFSLTRCIMNLEQAA